THPCLMVLTTEVVTRGRRSRPLQAGARSAQIHPSALAASRRRPATVVDELGALSVASSTFVRMELEQKILDLVGVAQAGAPGEALGLFAGIARVGRAVLDSALAPGGPWASEEDRVALVNGAQEALGALTAAQIGWTCRFAALTIVDNDTTGFEQVDRGVGFVDEFASDTLAPLLGMSHGAATTKTVRAAKLASDLPVTLAALAAGELDLFRAQCIAEELAEVDHDVCALVEQMVHPKITGDTPMKARNRVRAALAEIDPDLVRERAARAKLDR